MKKINYTRRSETGHKKRYKVNKPRFVLSILILFIFLWISFKLISGAFNFIAKNLNNNSNENQVNSISSLDDKNKSKENNTLNNNNAEIKTSGNELNQNNDNDSESNPINITILATGDILYHLGMINAGYNSATESYDFTSHYEKVKDLISNCDLSLANFEGTMAEELAPLSAYPLFNAPDAVATALNYAGFDALATANNHCLDSGIEGIETTIDAIVFNKMNYFGTRKNISEDLLVKDVKGVKVGLLAYTEYFNGLDQNIPEDKMYMISPMIIDNIKTDIKKIKSMGADLVILYLHWGVEYDFYPSDEQREIAHDLIDSGADMILGCHPHVLQETEIIKRDGDDKFIIYSMGNGISNQRVETIDNKYTETGVLLKFDIEKDKDKTKIKTVQMFPTWVNSFVDINGNRKFELLNTQDFVEGGKYRDSVPSSTLDRILDAREYALKILNGEF